MADTIGAKNKESICNLAMVYNLSVPSFVINKLPTDKKAAELRIQNFLISKFADPFQQILLLLMARALDLTG